jgi:tripartite-type tricarboxylate transporter receptor subunit TctC
MRLLVLAALFMFFAAGALGQVYPAKPVRIIVAQAAGGASDLLIRVIAQKLTENLGHTFIIDNRPGAGGNVGAEIAAKSPADGYTLFMLSAPHTIAPSLYRKLSYDVLRDFTPVTPLGSEPLCAVVHPSIPVKTVRDFAAFLKQRPRQVSYGSSGNGAVNHLATELFKSRAGVDMVHVPYKGSAAAIPDAISGVVPVLFANVSPLLPHVRAGKLRALAVTSLERVRVLHEVPTFAESGYPGYDAVNWFSMAAPARSPDDIVRKLNAAFTQTLTMPAMREYYESRGANVTVGTPEEMRSYIQSEVQKWAAVVRASGARVD